jgi:DedD protein
MIRFQSGNAGHTTFAQVLSHQMRPLVEVEQRCYDAARLLSGEFVAYSPLADAPDQARQRTVRRLVIVLILIAVAIVALALLDRASKRVTVPPEPTAKPAPLPVVPAPPSTPAAMEPAQSVLPPAVVEPTPKELPPPPAVLNNETLPPPKQVQPRRSSEPTIAEDTHPSKAADAEPLPSEKPGSAATLLPKLEARSGVVSAPRAFLLQLGVFSSAENAKVLQDRLAKAGIQTYAETRVHVGPFKDKAEAEKARATLKELGVKAVIVPQP